MKNNLICCSAKRILYLSDTYAGSVHDKTILDQEAFCFPSGITLYQDSGFQGHNPLTATIMQAAKKPKGKELNIEQKQANQAISKIRVQIEHAIGKVKILRIVKDRVRCWKSNIKDFLMEICCAIHNFKLTCTMLKHCA